jgi:Zn-dependent peptidase ImmA (M78 family)
MASVRVEVKPELLRWACERAGPRGVALRESFPNLAEWIEGTERPTLRQLEDFANKARVSVGYLFLPTPPVESLPVQDLRTVRSQGVRRPSPDLIDVIYLCQRRQDWYREYAEQHEDPKAFVGSATLQTPAEQVAAEMRTTLEFGVEDRQAVGVLSEAMRVFIERAESAGVLVMVGGMVGHHTRRTLVPDEFRGFALVDSLAPLVFVNSADAESAQMFTLAHELAHLWLGSSALSDASLPATPSDRTEQWCNRVAAEFLVPLAALRAVKVRDPLADLRAFTNRFKVSRPVILRRLLDAGMISREQFEAAYAVISQPVMTRRPETGGGSFFNTFPRSASRRFIRALCAEAIEGKTSYRDALQLLGIKKTDTLRELARRVGAA